jgi:hypothetical protein
VQNLLVAQLQADVAVGLRPGVGLSLELPLRMVRDRIRFEDAARQPYVRSQPDTHHRNETLTHLSDPMVAVTLAHAAVPWTLSARGGASLPLGRTEDNPFALGRLGLPHQHIQFGTGTVDPMLEVGAGRKLGAWSLGASAYGRWTLAENSHGYRAGDRYSLNATLGREVAKGWLARGGLGLAREQAERWSGVIEEEGNLGRTDLRLLLGATRVLGAAGSLDLGVFVPLASHATGAQTKEPWIARLAWSR